MKVGGKGRGLNPAGRLKRVGWRRVEEGGRLVVAVKCIDIAHNSDCEAVLPPPV